MTRRTRRFSAAVACGFATVMLAAQPAAADSIRDRQWHLKYLNIDAVHAISQGDGVVVAVVDSGVNGNHPDLTGNVLPGVDVSGNGTNGLEDRDGHGTAMAGLIAGHGHGTGDGALGIAPHAKIFPVRDSLTKDPAPQALVAGINAAVRSGAKVISISQGGGSVPGLEEAIKSALDADAVVVAAMGNKPEQILPALPAALDGVVAVGATDQDGNIASVSVTGPDMVLTAPGVRIVSTDGIGGYRIADGTSDATAIVAGAVALVRSKYPNLKAPEVIHRLTATATDKGPPGRDSQYGYGIVNIVDALKADVPPLTPSASPSQPGTAPTTQPNAAPPSDKKSSSAAPIVILVVLVIVLAGAAVFAWMLFRRRGQTPVA